MNCSPFFFHAKSVVGLAVLAGLLIGCSPGPAYTGPQRFAVEGTVTFGNEPIEGGSISLIPITPEGRVSGGPIVAGKFSVAANQGPTAGIYRVEIRWPRSTGKMHLDYDTGEMINEFREAIPAKFNTASELTVTIDKSPAPLDFKLTP